MKLFFNFLKIFYLWGEPRSRPCYKKRVYSTQPPLLFQGFSRSSSAKIGSFVKSESKKYFYTLDIFWNSLQIWWNEVISLYHWTPRCKLKKLKVIFAQISKSKRIFVYCVLTTFEFFKCKEIEYQKSKKRVGPFFFDSAFSSFIIISSMLPCTYNIQQKLGAFFSLLALFF